MDTKLTALYDLGQKLILLRDARQIAETVLEIAERVLDFQDSDFWLVDQAQRKLYVVANHGHMQSYDDPHLSLDGEQGVTVAAARSAQPVYVPDVRLDPRYIYSGFSAVSELAVPVQIEDRVLGVVNVESTQRDAFSAGDQELLAILASQAALALENARLHEEEHRQAEEMRILNQLSRRMSASLDLQATLEAIVAAADELIHCDLAEVSLWDEGTQLLTLQAIRCEPDRSLPVGCSYPKGEGYTGWLVEHRQPLLVPDVDARHDIHIHLLPGERPFKAYAGVPLLAGEELVGTLVLVANTAGAFSPADMRLLQALAHQAEVAIHNARLYAQEAHRRQELAALYAVAETINQALDLDQILEEGLKQAMAVTGLEMGAIALQELPSHTLVLKSHHGMSLNFLNWLQERLGKKSLEECSAEEEIHISEIPQYCPQVPASVQEEGIHLTADIPLFAERELVGVLTVATRKTRSFTPEERSLLQAVGHQLGTAIANARLRQEALTAARLAAVGRVATSVAHDLRSPLGGILRSAEFLARPELSPRTRQKLSQAIVSLARRLINTTQEILDYVRGGRLPLRRKPCALPDFLDEVLAVLEVDFSDRGIEVVRDCGYDGSLVMDTDRVAQVIYNIAANARDAMPRGGTFTVTTREAGGRVELRFSDTGPGVPPELSDRIFEPFFTYGKREGAGLGLSIARRIIQEHCGELWMEGDEGRGATFIVSLPLC